MKCSFALLTGILLPGLAMQVQGQAARFPGHGLDQLLSQVARSVITPDTPVIDRRDTGPVNQEVLKGCCERIATSKRRIYYLSCRSGKMLFLLKGIYTRESWLFFHFYLSNQSYIDYECDSIRFFLVDKAGRKQGRGKVTELLPIYRYGARRILKGKSDEPAVIVLPRFTLPPEKRLLIEVREKNGGRCLQIQADNFTLVRARLV